jgi:hypothetical protein
MKDLLEDPDGAPYPEEVQTLWRDLNDVMGSLINDGTRRQFVEALESVARQTWKLARR